MLGDDEFGITEPNAQTRGAAHNLRMMYIALKKEGFTEEQALTLIGHILAATNGSPE